VTLQPSAPHKRQRWLALLVVVMTLTVVGASLVYAHGAASIPANYAGGIQVDVHGANDVPGQVDVTQMGRDTSENPDIRIFWAWDSISAWTGSGQTGDACALFDDEDADAFIDYVVCARVSNPNADPNVVSILPASANHPVYIFDCSNKKNDRCTNPDPRDYTAGQVEAGPLGALTQAGTGNLISETDPFYPPPGDPVGESFPHDSTIDIRIDSALVPTGVRLANVCSYPSAGNGGNNNPFDCIVTPGVQFGTLRVVKNLVDDNGGDSANEDFSFKVNGGTSVSFEADGTNELTVAVGTYSVVENAAAGYTTTYTNSLNANTNCTNLTVVAGGTTTCTIKNDDDINTPGISTVMEWTLEDSATLSGFVSGGGVSTVTFSLYKDSATCTGTPVFTQTVNVNDADGTAQTTSGYTTTVAAEYRWVASFSGNSFNASVTADCDDEVTTLP
jgi:hypothetical protein